MAESVHKKQVMAETCMGVFRHNSYGGSEIFSAITYGGKAIPH